MSRFCFLVVAFRPRRWFIGYNATLNFLIAYLLFSFFQVCPTPQELWPDCLLSGEKGKLLRVFSPMPISFISLIFFWGYIKDELQKSETQDYWDLTS